MITTLLRMNIPKRVGLVFAVLLSLVAALIVHADRSSENIDPAYMFEKKSRFFEAATYYHRTLRGLREVYIAFHWDNNPAKYAAGKYAKEYVNWPKEVEDRYQNCLKQSKMTKDQRKQMEFINDMWMSELVDFEGGGQRQNCIMFAREAEKHGDFTAAEILRRGEARFYRVVCVPYHEKAAKASQKEGNKTTAALHRKAVKEYEQRATICDKIARGNKVLKGIPGLVGPNPWTEIRLVPERVNPVAFQNLYARWWEKSGEWVYRGEWKGASASEVAAILREKGLKHSDENVRLSAVTVLANIGEREAIVLALSDASSIVRLNAAKALASLHWTEGWAVCHKHSDAKVRAAVEPLLKPASQRVYTNTYAITALIDGLQSKSSEVSSFCESALRRLSSKSLKGAAAWSSWWKDTGGTKPGLLRKGPNQLSAIDTVIDFGTWWDYWISHAPNPLVKYVAPATIRWDGYVIVTQPGEYRFYVRNCGEGISGETAVNTPGRVGFPGLFMPSPCAKLAIDGKNLIPNSPNEVLDPNGMRLDIGKQIYLDEGLHKLSLEFEWRGGEFPESMSNQPSVRLYWSSEHFLRELVPADHLIHLEKKK